MARIGPPPIISKYGKPPILMAHCKTWATCRASSSFQWSRRGRASTCGTTSCSGIGNGRLKIVARRDSTFRKPKRRPPFELRRRRGEFFCRCQRRQPDRFDKPREEGSTASHPTRKGYRDDSRQGRSGSDQSSAVQPRGDGGKGCREDYCAWPPRCAVRHLPRG